MNPSKTIAQAELPLSPASLNLLKNPAKRQELLWTAQAAGLLAAKRSHELVPSLAIQLIEELKLELEIDEERAQLLIRAELAAESGDLPSLTGVSVAALSVFDLLKAYDPQIEIRHLRVLERPQGEPTPLRIVPKISTPPANPFPPEPPSQPQLSTCAAPPRLAPPSLSDSARALLPLIRELPGESPEIYALLVEEPMESAYMLGKLASPFNEHCRWFGLLRGGELKSLLLSFSGLSRHTIFSVGDPIEIEAIFRAKARELPLSFQAHIPEEHRRAFEVSYNYQEPKRMVRMGLERAHFSDSSEVEGVVQLSHRDTGALMRLFLHHPDNFFEPSLLDIGLFAGIWDEDELVCAMGLHILDERHRVAAVGNMVTHADYRRRGYATRCARWLLQETFKRVDCVALNVLQESQEAILLYQSFGFKEHFRFFEGWATRR